MTRAYGAPVIQPATGIQPTVDTAVEATSSMVASVGR
jgi:hypothetical protein